MSRAPTKKPMPDQAPTEPHPWPTIEVPQCLTPQDFAKLQQVSLFVARQQFRRFPTIKIGRFRRMSFATYKKHFIDKELIHYT
jgi:hypothetical protein